MTSVTIDRTSRVTLALVGAVVLFVAGAAYGLAVRDTRLEVLERRVDKINDAMPWVVSTMQRMADRMGVETSEPPKFWKAGDP